MQSDFLFPLLNEELDLWKMTFAEVSMNNRILVYNVNWFNMWLYIYVFFSISFSEKFKENRNNNTKMVLLFAYLNSLYFFSFFLLID